MKFLKTLDFTPTDKIVVTFDKYRTFISKYSVVDKEKSTPENTETKIVKKKVKFNIQEARVIAVPKTEKDIKVNDIVILDMHSCMDLNGYKNMFLVQRYNILGVKDINYVEEYSQDDAYPASNNIHIPNIAVSSSTGTELEYSTR